MTREEAIRQANTLCRRRRETFWVVRDSLDAFGEYRVVDASEFPRDTRHIRYSAQWTGQAVHGTCS